MRSGPGEPARRARLGAPGRASRPRRGRGLRSLASYIARSASTNSSSAVQPGVAVEGATPMLALTRAAAAVLLEHAPRGSLEQAVGGDLAPGARRSRGGSRRTRRRRSARACRTRAGARAAARRRSDQLVAGAVAERVVDVLEVVEVEHQDRAARGRSARRAISSRSSSSSKRRRLIRPVSGSWSARYWSWPSKRLRSEMSSICSEAHLRVAVGVAYHRVEMETQTGRRRRHHQPDLAAVRRRVAGHQPRAVGRGHARSSGCRRRGLGHPQQLIARVAGDLASSSLTSRKRPSLPSATPITPCRSRRPRTRGGSAPRPRSSLLAAALLGDVVDWATKYSGRRFSSRISEQARSVHTMLSSGST